MPARKVVGKMSTAEVPEPKPAVQPRNSVEAWSDETADHVKALAYYNAWIAEVLAACQAGEN
jgi:hypothetical protein